MASENAGARLILASSVAVARSDAIEPTLAASVSRIMPRHARSQTTDAPHPTMIYPKLKSISSRNTERRECLTDPSLAISLHLPLLRLAKSMAPNLRLEFLDRVIG